MYKLLLVTCLVMDFNADGGATCYLYRDNELYRTEMACSMVGNYKKSQAVEMFTSNSQGKFYVLGESICMKQDSL